MQWQKVARVADRNAEPPDLPTRTIHPPPEINRELEEEIPRKVADRKVEKSRSALGGRVIAPESGIL